MKTLKKILNWIPTTAYLLVALMLAMFLLPVVTMELLESSTPSQRDEAPSSVSTSPEKTEAELVNEAAVKAGYCGCSILCHDTSWGLTYLKERDSRVPYAACLAVPVLCLSRPMWGDECKEPGVTL